MNDQRSTDESVPVSKPAEAAGASAASNAGEPAAPAKLTPEEQMALYEEDLKETDWGHQPC